MREVRVIQRERENAGERERGRVSKERGGAVVERR